MPCISERGVREVFLPGRSIRRFSDVLVADLRRAQSDHCLERLWGGGGRN